MTPQERDLATLLRAYAGDTRALGELYDRYATLLHSVATATLKGASPEDVAEMVRDVWRQVWTRTVLYDPDSGSVALWLVLRVRDRAIERGHALPAGTEAERLVMGTLRRQDRPIAATTDDILVSDRARNMLARLTPLERQALAAALFERLTFERISARLEITEETARTWVRQGLQHLGELRPEEARV
jgi:RNA polymerase sigma-70 factor (ECF subfamily)